MSTTSASPPGPGMQQLPGTWDAVASTYAAEWGRWSTYADEALRIVPVTSSDRVLDVASGPGTLAFAAAPHAARVDAVDFSPAMIEELRARAAREGVTNVAGTVMDAQSLIFEDSIFDAAFSLFGFFFFPDRAQAFREIHRVLRPSGRAMVVTWAPIERRPLMGLAFEAMAEALPQFPRPGKGDLQSPEDCIREMSDAGFREVSATLFSASIRIDSPERYLEMLVRTGAPLAVMKKKLGDGAFDAAMNDVLAVLRRRLPEGGTELAAEAIFTRGVR
jgi:ubiquinone/menaquinone biosynthesis C-methylase UbiE